jgi:hypothetical protein
MCTAERSDVRVLVLRVVYLPGALSGTKEYIPNPFLYLLHLGYLLIGGTFIGLLTSKTFNVAMKCGWLGLSLSPILASTLR